MELGVRNAVREVFRPNPRHTHIIAPSQRRASPASAFAQLSCQLIVARTEERLARL